MSSAFRNYSVYHVPGASMVPYVAGNFSGKRPARLPGYTGGIAMKVLANAPGSTTRQRKHVQHLQAEKISFLLVIKTAPTLVFPIKKAFYATFVTGYHQGTYLAIGNAPFFARGWIMVIVKDT